MKVEALGELIKKNNEAFTKMSNAEKRVEVAKDTLLRIEMKQLDAYTGSIIQYVNTVKDKYGKTSIQDVINTDSKFTCQVCAKGAMFMSYVGRVNKMEFCDINTGNYGQSSVHTKLGEIFSLEQLALIELAFEGEQYLKYLDDEDDFDGTAVENIILSDNDYNQADLFHNSYGNVDYRLIAICENIIKNEGTFKP
jgi:hypothetical protein